MTLYSPAPAPTAPRGKRQYSLLAAMVLAPAFSSALSRDVARNWRGIAAWYLFLLLLITCIVPAAQLHTNFRNWARDDFPAIVEKFPPITITDGVVSSPVDQPYVIDDPKSHKPFFILDTTGQITSLKDTPANVLVTKTGVITRDEDQGEGSSFDVSKIKSLSVDRARATQFVESVRHVLFGVAWPITVIFAFIFRLLQALIYALIGMGIAAGFRARLSYASLVRLSILSVTPVILAETVLDFAAPNLPLWTLLVAFVISMFYLTMAIRANASDAPPAYVYEPPYVPPYAPPM